MNRYITRLLPVFITLTLAFNTVASGESESNASGFRQPSPEMKHFIETFTGEWTVTERHAPSEWWPDGLHGDGKARFKAGPGNLSLIQEYNSTSSYGAFEGMGVTWWIPEEGRYHGIWCENTSPNGCIDSGAMHWKDDQLVAEYEVVEGNEKMKLRREISAISAGSFTATIDMGRGNTPKKRMLTIFYKRLK